MARNIGQVFEFYNTKSKAWVELKPHKGEAKTACFARCKAEGLSIRVLHKSGSFFTIANADKLPKGVTARFSAKAEARKAKAKKAKAKPKAKTIQAKAMEYYLANHA